MKKRSLWEPGTLYVLTDHPIFTHEYTKDIAFEHPHGSRTYLLSLNNDDHWCKDVNILNCDNSDHRPYQRAEYVLSIAINAYQNKIGEMPKNIHMRWDGMKTSPPTPKDIKKAIKNLKREDIDLSGINFTGIYNSSSSELSSISMFAMAAAIAAPTIAYLYSHYSQENSHS